MQTEYFHGPPVTDTGASTTQPRPTWAWIGLVVAAAGVPLALLSGLGYRAGWWPYAMGFRILTAAAVTGALGAAASLVAVFANWGLHRMSTARAATGLTIGLVVAVIPLQWKMAAERLPPIHDITTDPQDPPRFVRVQRLRAPGDHPTHYAGEALAIKQHAAYPDIRPLHTRLDRASALYAARQVLRDMGLQVVDESVTEGRIEAVDRTRLFGFRDDLVVRVREGPAGTRVDARSMSRLGRSDLGQNAKRLRSFFSRLRARLAA